MIQLTTLAVREMACETCVRHVERALEGMTGVTGVHVSLPRQQVRVEYLADWVDVTSLAAALRDSGYEARPIAHDIYTGIDG